MFKPLTTALAVLLLVPALAFAQVYGDWVIDTKHATSPYAASANDSGHVFGQWCVLSDGMCYWLLALDTRCEKGEKHPVLVNSNAGSFPLEILCDGLVDTGKIAKYRYVFTDFAAVDKVIRQASQIGIALPLQQDKFLVVRTL